MNLAKKYQVSPAQMALAYVTQREFVTSNIIGATPLNQLKENLGSSDLVLSAELLREIESIHSINSNPCP